MKFISLIARKAYFNKFSALTLIVFSGFAVADSNCPAGFFGPEDSFDCEPAPPGYFVPNPGATEPTIAPAGTFVPIFGATAATLAPPGSFVATEGQTSAELAPPGYFVAESGATAPTIAPAGSFVSSSGATAATLAPPGSFVATEGQTSAELSAPGYFVAESGATAPTIAPAGTFVSSSGATAATLAAPGSFVATEGQTSAELAPPGYFVAESGATEPTISPVGYYAVGPGAVQAVPAAAGFYAPEEGSVITLICPDDSTSYGAAPACREGFISMNNPDTIGPDFSSNFGLGGTFDLGVLDTNINHSFEFEISNLANFLGGTDDLTSLSLLDAGFSGVNADLFSLSGYTPAVLGEQESIDFNIELSSMMENPFDVDLTFSTDQFATFGAIGQDFVFNFVGSFSRDSTAVSEPNVLLLAMFMAGLILYRSKKQEIKNGVRV